MTDPLLTLVVERMAATDCATVNYFTQAELSELAQAALSVIREQEGWRPISEAPKDGTRVLVWAEQYSAPCSAEHNGLRGWCIMGPELKYQPTHFRPPLEKM